MDNFRNREEKFLRTTLNSLVPDYERKQIVDWFTLRGYNTCTSNIR